MKNFRSVFCLTLVILLLSCVFSTSVFAKDDMEEQKNTIIFFYTTGCTSCKQVDGYIEEHQIQNVTKLNITDEQNNNDLQEYFKYFNVPENEHKTPIIFAGDRYFSGKEAILNGLAPYVKSGDFSTPILKAEKSSDEINKEKFESLNYIPVFFTGLVNGLNPCSLSILLLLVSLLSAKNVNILKLGSAFCFGKFLTYMLIGTLLYNFINLIDFNKYAIIYKAIVGVICLFFIIFNFRDFWFARKENYKEVKLQLPNKLKKFNNGMVRRINLVENGILLAIVCVVIGVITSLGEFMCTGQIYLTSILYYLHNTTAQTFQAFIFFLLYSLGFIVPFFVVTLIVHKGSEIFDISDLLRSKLHIIKLINVILFTVILVLTLLQ